MRNLGLIKRTWKSFHDPLALKTLYRSLVRSNLEYCPLIWINNTIIQNDVIELVQNSFLRFIAYKLNKNRPVHGSYQNILDFSNISPLNKKRLYLLFKFLQKLIFAKIDIP